MFYTSPERRLSLDDALLRLAEEWRLHPPQAGRPRTVPSALAYTPPATRPAMPPAAPAPQPDARRPVFSPGNLPPLASMPTPRPAFEARAFQPPAPAASGGPRPPAPTARPAGSVAPAAPPRVAPPRVMPAPTPVAPTPLPAAPVLRAAAPRPVAFRPPAVEPIVSEPFAAEPIPEAFVPPVAAPVADAAPVAAPIVERPLEPERARVGVLGVEREADDRYLVTVGRFARCSELLAFCKAARELPQVSGLTPAGIEGGVVRLGLTYVGRMPLERYLGELLPTGRIADLKGSAAVQPLVLGSRG